MAELAFSTIGAAIGGSLLPFGGATLGHTLGALAGSQLDTLIFGPEIQGTRIEELALTQAREGAPLHNAYGRSRLNGQIIWAGKFREHLREPGFSSGGKGGPTLLEYTYTVSFAVGICAGPIQDVSRIWANGAPLDLSTSNVRIYYGDETQNPDPLIEAIEGSGQVPAFRGLAYIVFEDLPLDDFGARIPQFSFEILRGTGGDLEQNLRTINLAPASGEFVYATDIIRREDAPGIETPENMYNNEGRADFALALDQLANALPDVNHIHLLVGWFGNDLRMGTCMIRPGVETRDKNTRPRQWSVAQQNRNTAWLVQHDTNGYAAFGGTPDDSSVKEGIALAKALGYKVTLYPCLFVDVPPQNTLTDPYGGTQQEAWPWRGRITTYPAPGLPASLDRTILAISQTYAFFGTASAEHFQTDANGDSLYLGPDEWRYRRFILHYAALGAAAGIDGFLIGSEMQGMTRLRDHEEDFPVISALKDLAAQARQILGADTEISYAANWAEYGAYIPEQETGNVYFPLDALWADPNIDYIGVNWFAPMADWRDGTTHLDAQTGATGPHDPAYLETQIEGGEFYDWSYASQSEREFQHRLPIIDESYNEPWIYRQKDIRNWWNNLHYHRLDGIRQDTPTAWTPQSKPVRFIETGCPAIDKGANQPHISSDPGPATQTLPFASNGTRDDLIQRRYLTSFMNHWQADNSGMVEDIAAWAWDARPYPSFPALEDVWPDSHNWAVGHWLNGRASLPLLPSVIESVLAEAGLEGDVSGLDGVVAGYAWNGPQSARRVLEPLQTRFGFNVIERDGRLLFTHSHSTPTTQLDHDRLVISSETQNPVAITRTDMETRNGALRIRFVDSETDFQAALEQIEGEPNAPVKEVSIPLVMDHAQARLRARELQAESEASTSTAYFELSPAMAALEAGDLVQIDNQDWQITHLSEGQRRQAQAVRPTQTAPVLAGPNIGSPSNLQMSPRPDMVLLDAPALPGSENDLRPLVFAFAEPWTGPIRLAAGPDRTSLTTRATLSYPAIMGHIASPAAPACSGRWYQSGFEVKLQNGTLSSLPDANVLAGANAALLETAQGWELLQYQSAELIESGHYQLRRLLRGQQGSELQAAAGADTESRIIFLSGPSNRAEIGVSEIELPLVWQASAGLLTGDGAASGDFTYQPIAQKPWSPVHVRASRSGSDVRLDWIRRARIGGDTWESENVPLEGLEAYRVEIWSEERLEQVITTTVPFAEFTLSTAVSARIAQIGIDGRAGHYAHIVIPN